MKPDNSNPAEAWGGVADAWDANADANEGPTSDATARLVEWLAVQPGERVLELAAGPGSLGATWARLVGPTGGVVLSDVAPAMVDAARRRSEALDNVDTAVIDAAAIDLPDASFDIVACRMGLMFTPTPGAAVAEMHRVLRPGGRLGILTWGGIEQNPWMTCVGMAAMANGIVAGGPPNGAGGIFSLADPAELEQLATAAGFTDVNVSAVDVAFTAPSIDAHLERVTSLAGPLALALRAAPPDRYTEFRRTATELATPYLTATGLEIPGVALLTTGRRSTAR
jgi:SAM-dependent methyltransferase